MDPSSIRGTRSDRIVDNCLGHDDLCDVAYCKRRFTDTGRRGRLRVSRRIEQRKGGKLVVGGWVAENATAAVVEFFVDYV